MKFIFTGGSTEDCLLPLREICKSLTEINCPPPLNLVTDQLDAFSNFEIAERFLLEYGINKQGYHSIFQQLISKVLMSHSTAESQKTIETSFQNYMFYPKLHQLFPEADFIFILRDGRDVLASELILEKKITGKPILSGKLRNYAINWINSIGTGLSGIAEIKNAGANTSVIKYEDLLNPSSCKNIISTIASCDSTTDSSLNRIQTNQWRSTFTEEQIEVLKDELHEVLEQLGYLNISPW